MSIQIKTDSSIQSFSEELDVEMIKPAPYLYFPETEGALEFERLVDLTADQFAPPGEIIVRSKDDHYELIFGYDYFMAYRKALPTSKKVPVTRYHLQDSEAFNNSIQLAERYYRPNLIEIVDCYSRAMNNFGWSKNQIGEYLGLARSTITNRFWLLNLNRDITNAVKSNEITIEHAKLLSRLTSSEQTRLLKRVVSKDLSTRQLLKLIKPEWEPKGGVALKVEPPVKSRETKWLESHVGERISTPVDLAIDNKSNGVMKLRFTTLSELAGIVERVERLAENDHVWAGEVCVKVSGHENLDNLLQGIHEKEF